MGKRRKHEQKRHYRKALLLAIGLIFIITTVIFIFAKTNLSGPQETAQKPVQKIFIAFHQERTGPTTWLIDKEDLGKELEVQSMVKSRIERYLNSYADKDKRIRQLRDAFANNLYITHFTPAGSSRLVGKNIEDLQKPNDPKNLEITIYGKHTANHPKIAGSFFYDSDWQAVFLPAIEMSEPWFEAVSIHELWHAMSGKVLKMPGTKAPFLSDLWVEEEITAFQVESALLNETTKGKYLEAINSIVENRQGKSLDGFLNSLQLDDFRRLDALFSKEKVSEYEIGLRLALYTTDLTMRWTEIKRDQGLPESKVENLRFLFRSLGSRPR